jgi:hypothetical protein
MPVTVSDLIHSSFRLIGAIAAGETLETNELNDALISLNQMLASWNTEGASLVGRTRLVVQLSAINGPYVLPTRPVKIESASTFMDLAQIDNPLEIVDAVGWEAIDEKLALAMRTQKLFCDYLYPQSSVYVWPVPRAGGSIRMWIYALIPAFATLDQSVDLPPGYEIALRYNFAVSLLPEYPRSQVDPTLPALAQNYKASIVQLNATNHMQTHPPVVVQGAS